MPITDDNLEDVFRHHPPTTVQVDHYHAIRQAAMTLAETILRYTKTCDDQQAALRHVRDAMMTANAAVALDGNV